MILIFKTAKVPRVRAAMKINYFDDSSFVNEMKKKYINQ